MTRYDMPIFGLHSRKSGYSLPFKTNISEFTYNLKNITISELTNKNIIFMDTNKKNSHVGIVQIYEDKLKISFMFTSIGAVILPGYFNVNNVYIAYDSFKVGSNGYLYDNITLNLNYSQNVFLPFNLSFVDETIIGNTNINDPIINKITFSPVQNDKLLKGTNVSSGVLMFTQYFYNSFVISENNTITIISPNNNKSIQIPLTFEECSLIPHVTPSNTTIQIQDGPLLSLNFTTMLCTITNINTIYDLFFKRIPQTNVGQYVIHDDFIYDYYNKGTIDLLKCIGVPVNIQTINQNDVIPSIFNFYVLPKNNFYPVNIEVIYYNGVLEFPYEYATAELYPQVVNGFYFGMYKRIIDATEINLFNYISYSYQSSIFSNEVIPDKFDLPVKFNNNLYTIVCYPEKDKLKISLEKDGFYILDNNNSTFGGVSVNDYFLLENQENNYAKFYIWPVTFGKNIITISNYFDFTLAIYGKPPFTPPTNTLLQNYSISDLISFQNGSYQFTINETNINMPISSGSLGLNHGWTTPTDVRIIKIPFVDINGTNLINMSIPTNSIRLNSRVINAFCSSGNRYLNLTNWETRIKDSFPMLPIKYVKTDSQDNIHC
jgi:hypothetical protein